MSQAINAGVVLTINRLIGVASGYVGMDLGTVAS